VNIKKNSLKTDWKVEIYIAFPRNKKCGDNKISVATFVAIVLIVLDSTDLVDNNYVNIEEKDEEGMTALHKAVEYTRGHVDYLIGKGANVNAKDNLGRTSLHVAAGVNLYGMGEVVNTLLNNDADLEARDLEGMTALHHAAREGLPGVNFIKILRAAFFAIVFFEAFFYLLSVIFFNRILAQKLLLKCW